MGNHQVNPGSGEEEQVTQFLCSRIPSLDCYTCKEPTFKDCFIARDSWIHMTTHSSTSPTGGPHGPIAVRHVQSIAVHSSTPSHSTSTSTSTSPATSPSHSSRSTPNSILNSTHPTPAKGERGESESKSEDVQEHTTPPYTHTHTHNSPDCMTSPVFFLLFFKKLALLNPESKLSSAEGGYFLQNLLTILLMGATSVHNVERFAYVYGTVELSEYGHIGEALMQALDETIRQSLRASGDTLSKGGTKIGTSGLEGAKWHTSSELRIVRAWNRIYSRFLRYLAPLLMGMGAESVYGRRAGSQVPYSDSQVPDCLLDLVGFQGREHTRSPKAQEQLTIDTKYTHTFAHTTRSKTPSPKTIALFLGSLPYPPPTPCALSRLGKRKIFPTTCTPSSTPVSSPRGNTPSFNTHTSFIFKSSTPAAKSVAWILSDKRVLSSKQRRRHSIHV
ncbi:hypothetical protein B484DRAFT_445834 [Ochromonadaceae sp. CCMP2298]|nr:hypothetical protein B484DRAFT_445834 [Ochromonadaceae sp. CCMP2298]